MASEVVKILAEKLQNFQQELTVDKLKELLKKYPKSAIFGLLLISGRVYLYRKWSFWSKKGVKGPPPRISSNSLIFYWHTSVKIDFPSYFQVYLKWVTCQNSLQCSTAQRILSPISMARFRKNSIET